MSTAVPDLPAPQGSPYRIGFVCLGNICRSPTADVVLSDLVDRAGLSTRVQVESCGTGPWHVDEAMDRRAAGHLLAEGYDPSGHRARQYDAGWRSHDLLLAMDASNLADIGGEADRVRLFRSFDPVAGDDLDVPDPFFGGDEGFAEVLAIVERTCAHLLAGLQALDLGSR